LHEVDLLHTYHDFSYVGRLFVKGAGKAVEVLTKLNEMAGYAPDEDIELYEVCSLSFLLFYFFY
jgi:hypothetical protein